MSPRIQIEVLFVRHPGGRIQPGELLVAARVVA
jgi:hypothetical protein